MIDLHLPSSTGALRVLRASSPSLLPAPALWLRWRSRVALLPECRVDLAARAAWRDPVQFRRERLAPGSPARAVLDDAARRARWDSTPAPGAARGVALGQAAGHWLAVVAEVDGDASGAARVRRLVVTASACAPAEAEAVRHALRRELPALAEAVPIDLVWLADDGLGFQVAEAARQAARAAVRNADVALRAAQARARALAAAD